MGIQDDINRERSKQALEARQKAFEQKVRDANYACYWADVVTPVGRWKDLVDEILPVLRQHGQWTTETMFVNGDGGNPPLPCLMAYPSGVKQKSWFKKTPALPSGSRPVRSAKVQFGWRSGSGYYSPGSPEFLGLLESGDLVVSQNLDMASTMVELIRGEGDPNNTWQANFGETKLSVIRQWVVGEATKR